MALLRSDSAKTTLSVYVSRAGKYQSWLVTINVILIISSLCLIFAGWVFMSKYHMDKLDFVSMYFFILPWSLVAVGIITLLGSALGFVTSGSESRPRIITYAGIMAIIGISTIGVIFVILEARTLIRDKAMEQGGNINVIGATDLYTNNDKFRSNWDQIQQEIRCCGADNYRDFKKFQSNCVPESCCIDILNCDTNRCHSINDNMDDLWNKIYTQGCLPILQKMYEQQLEVNLIIFGILQVIIVLVEVVAVALASAFVGQITRRKKRLAASTATIPGLNTGETFIMS